MINDRPIDDANLQAALDEVRAVMKRRGVAGAVMLVAPQEAAFTYKMDAPWSAIRPDPTTPLGFRFRASAAEEGNLAAVHRTEGGLHTICQLADFGTMTTFWMNDLKAMLRKAGIKFDHTPHGGKPLQHLDGR